MPLLLPLLLFALAVPAQAAVYKCTNEKGGVVYQDTACAPGTEMGNFASVPAARGAAAKPGTAPARSGNAADRRFLQAGMSETEVIQKVGRADVEDKGSSDAGVRWTYMPTTGDPDTLTTLTFVGGKVTSVERKAVH
jgi:Domain of unknown function (DUF4124)